MCACLVHQVTGMCLCGQQCSEQQDLAEIFLWREAITSRDLTKWKENKSLKQDILRGKPEWDADAGENQNLIHCVCLDEKLCDDQVKNKAGVYHLQCND